MSKLILLLFLVGCGTAVPIDPNTRFDHVDGRAVKYIKIFEKHWGKRIPFGTKLVIENIKEVNAGGYYHRKLDKTYINLRKWKKWDNDTKLMIISHELGHAILKRDHIDNWNFKDGCPDSAMFWSIRSVCFKKHKRHYMMELFMPNMKKFYPFNRRN